MINRNDFRVDLSHLCSKQTIGQLQTIICNLPELIAIMDESPDLAKAIEQLEAACSVIQGAMPMILNEIRLMNLEGEEHSA